MLQSILPYMRCSRCESTQLRPFDSGISCKDCRANYPLRKGILDLLGNDPGEVITPFQRLMQAAPVVSIYERIWRPLGYYVASSRSFSDEIHTVLKLLAGVDDSRVLDIACGPGIFTRPLARRNRGIVVGFDLSWPMLWHARRMADREGLRNVVLLRGTVFRLPFVAGAFPCINCCGALHLFDQPDLALREINRVLGPGGHLSIQTTIRPAHSGGLAFLLERFIRFGFFDEDELRERIRLQGFKILASERHRISYTLLARNI